MRFARQANNIQSLRVTVKVKMLTAVWCRFAVSSKIELLTFKTT